MKKKNQDAEYNITSFEQDLEEISALFDDIIQNNKLGTPRLEVIEKIHREAHSYSLKTRFRQRIRQSMRAAAAVAALLLLMAGGVRINSIQQGQRRAEVLNQLSIVCDTTLLQDELPQTSNDALASLLMEMQGLDAETYFAYN